jgi:hypothetical protein
MLHRHATDVVALVSGTIFAGLTAVWLLIITEAVDVEQAWIGGPVILIIAGVLGLLVTLTPSRSEPAPALPTWNDEPSDDGQYASVETRIEDPADDEPTTALPTSDEEPTTVLPSEDDPDDSRTDR